MKMENDFGLVPKIIHQTAMADKSKWHPSWVDFQKSWKTKFEEFEYKIWADEELEDLIRSKYNWFYDTYIGYKENIKRIDAARYFILNEFGGVYVDMDFECINNFWEVIPHDKISIAEAGNISVSRLENALMISPKGHKFWNFLFSKLEEFKNKQVFEATGPIFLDRCVNEYSKEDNDFLNVLNKKSFSLKEKNEKKYTIHHQTGVWTLAKKIQKDSFSYEKNIDYEVSISPHIYPDAFYVAVFEDKVVVKRKDCDHGWGQNLNLILKNKSSNETKILNVGPSDHNLKSINFPKFKKKN